MKTKKIKMNLKNMFELLIFILTTLKIFIKVKAQEFTNPQCFNFPNC